MAKKPAATRKIETVVTYLEMREEPKIHIHPPANLKLALMHCAEPTLHFYRYIYGTVGDGYHWVDRALLGDDELKKLIHAEGVDIFVAYVDGNPAGFFELIPGEDNACWLQYFGLIPEFYGRGLGKWLLSEAIATAWARKPEVVRVETCTLDGPRALPLYQRMGFIPYKREDKVMTVPV